MLGKQKAVGKEPAGCWVPPPQFCPFVAVHAPAAHDQAPPLAHMKPRSPDIPATHTNTFPTPTKSDPPTPRLLARRTDEFLGRGREVSAAQRRDAHLAGDVQLHLGQQLRTGTAGDAQNTAEAKGGDPQASVTLHQQPSRHSNLLAWLQLCPS